MCAGDGSKGEDQQCQDDGVDGVPDEWADEVPAIKRAEGFGGERWWDAWGETIPRGGVDEQ
jgi:hypothetical protein